MSFALLVKQKHINQITQFCENENINYYISYMGQTENGMKEVEFNDEKSINKVEKFYKSVKRCDDENDTKSRSVLETCWGNGFIKAS